MRVESKKQARNGGWIHRLNGDKVFRVKGDGVNLTAPSQPDVFIDIPHMMSGWRARQNGQLEPFAATLGVSIASLNALGCAYAPEYRAFAFPMYDDSGKAVGVRLRNDLGRKWAVRGSRQGLFMDEATVQAKTNSVTPASSLLIVEGPTDAAAAIDLGYAVIGRPACVGCEDMIVKLVRESSKIATFIIADNDAPGQRGAEKLKQKLRKAKIVTLPCKDLREFLSSCENPRQSLNAILSSAL